MASPSRNPYVLEIELEDDDFLDSEEEEVGLVAGRPPPSHSNVPHSATAANCCTNRRDWSTRHIWIGVLVLCSVLAFHWNIPLQADDTDEKPSSLFSTCIGQDEDVLYLNMEQENGGKSGVLQFACPCGISKEATTIAQQEHHRFQENSRVVLENVSNYLQSFRHMEYDDWGHSYEEVKKGMYQFKEKYFAENLKDNYTIYESACGMGMNLYMTLEIVHEVKGISNLVVYGSDYAMESVRAASTIAKEGLLPAGGQLGTICRSDSTDLRHVPSGTFDLVFTGYISPLSNPLGLDDVDDPFRAYSAICERAAKGDENAVKQKRDAQHKQDRWFAHWLREMIRIAKPGAPIIVEQVSYPFCEAIFDWGGVSQDFWKSAAKTRDLDVDLDSIVFETDKIFRKRYHVFMRKSKT